MEIKVKLSDLSEAQYRKYFEVRLTENRFRRSGIGYMALCCFHSDRNASLSINTEKGVWKCHTGCGQGGILEFERKFSNCDNDTAIARIAEIIGLPQLGLGQGPEAIYAYTDAFGKLLFQVVRYPGKKFTQRQPDSKGGWIYKTQGLKMTLYHLPEVITSSEIVICEGEKDVDNLRSLCLSEYPTMAVTTSPRGAGKWQDQFSLYLAGKQVLILPDNDEAGRKHAEVVALSAYRYAQGVKILELPGLPEKGDVSDYLKQHSVQDLLAAANAQPWWNPPEATTSLFMTVTEFEKNSAPAIEWLVEGVIQRGANGLMIARPKCGKSFAVLDLALAIASGQSWLDFFVPKRSKVALVSREDHYGLTQWRERKLRAFRALSPEELDGWLYINAKGLKPKFMLDDEEEIAALLRDLKRYETEFLILDVMRVMHEADENDNTEMQKIITVLNRIQEECGCSICMIHHDNKREDATLTERARGASAIAGYAEFICGLRVVDEAARVREFVCELKASMPPDRFYWKISDTADDSIRLERTEWTPPQPVRRGKNRSYEQGAEHEGQDAIPF